MDNNILADQFAHAIKRANEIRAKYDEKITKQIGPDPLMMLIPIFEEVIFEETGYKVDYLKVDWPQEQIRGRIEKYRGENRVEIHVPMGLNECWNRFVCIKELCHTFTDLPDAEICSVEQAELFIGELIRRDFINPLDGTKSTFLVSDLITVPMALNIAFPLAHRFTYAEKLESNKLTPFMVADIFKIPQHYVELALSHAAQAHTSKIIQAG